MARLGLEKGEMAAGFVGDTNRTLVPGRVTECESICERVRLLGELDDDGIGTSESSELTLHARKY